MYAMLQGQPPQEVLSYYVHGNGFIHRDGHPSEYTLGDTRTAYATRLAVNNQYQRHKPEPRHNPLPHTPSMYSPVPNHIQAPLVFQPQAAPHSFHPGYFSGHHTTHTFHDPNHFTLPHTPPTYFHAQHYTAQVRTPPTPALTEDQRSAATSPDRLEHHGHQPHDPAWMVHAALTHPANGRTWQPPHINLAPEYEEYQEPMYTTPKPGVGPSGHVLGGHAKPPRSSQPPLPAPGMDRCAAWENCGPEPTQPSYSSYVDPQVSVGTGRAADGHARPQARTRGVGPNGHVLGGGSKDRSAPDVLYDSSQQARGQPASASRARDAPSRTPGPVPPRPDIVVTSASSPPQVPPGIRTRPRALSRLSSMNLKNELDTVVEEEEPVPSPRVFEHPIKRTHSFPVCEDDDNEDAQTDTAASEMSVESAIHPETPKDEYDGAAPFVVLPASSPSADEIRYYTERESLISLSSKDNTPLVNIPKTLTLGVPNGQPLSRKAQRRAARR